MAGRNFGFVVQGGRRIDLDQADTAISEKISAAVGAWKACISCGSCAATCPAGFNFREYHSSVRIAPLAERLPFSSCFLCGKCQLVCPRGIPTRYLALQIAQNIKDYHHVAEGIPSV